MVDVGPWLAEVLAAQREEEHALAYPQVEAYARELAGLCRQLQHPVVWPVSPAAERLAGAAVVVSRGRTRVRGWTDDLRDERVLVLAVAAVTPLALFVAADGARCLGAAMVFAGGIHVQAFDEPRWAGLPYFRLEAPCSTRRRTA